MIYNLPKKYLQAKIEDFKDLSFYGFVLKYIKNPDRCLVVLGNVGVGKTHLACAIGKAINKHVLFKTAIDFNEEMSSSGSDLARHNYIRELYREFDIVLIDDFGTQKLTESSKINFYYLINYCYLNDNLFFLTTNLSLQDLEDYDYSTASRIFEISYFLTLKGEDKRPKPIII